MKRELWTVQDKRVLEELLSSGCYRVKRSYVMEKYGESAWIFQTAYDFQQQGDVGEVQAGGGFVEDVERSAGVAFGEFQGEFDALGFAAGEGGGGLAEADVA